jgi:hypothetical protein
MWESFRPWPRNVIVQWDGWCGYDLWEVVLTQIAKNAIVQEITDVLGMEIRQHKRDNADGLSLDFESVC